MLMPQRWISDILSHGNPDWAVPAADLDTGYVRVGFETEGYEPIPTSTGPIVFGRVEHIEELEGFKKPIRYCDVNVGQANGTGELQHIICGARNFAEGDTVIVSLPGAVLPGGFKISARETYGKVSEGMMCSAMELGLCKVQNPGIIALKPGPDGQPAEAGIGQPGEDAREFLGLDDTIFDVNVTPDRGYALSARGLAREVASSFDLNYTDPAVDPSVAGLTVNVPESGSEPGTGPIKLTISDDAVRRFGIRKVTGIRPGAQSPFWLQRLLMLLGQRPINAATDVTNYVMFLLGQPMHAFDAAKISGGLTVRRAEKGETLVTLDDQKRTLDPADLIITDEASIQSIAGVMGGSTSEISDETTDVYFEAANFDALTIARTSRRHKLSSESSRRFERGVDPALVEVALDIAASLLAEIAGGTVEAGRSIVGDVPAMDPIDISTNRASIVAGVDYPAGTTRNRLEEVGCTVEQTDREGRDGSPILSVTPPTWRPDLTMAADLVEEVLRLEGIEDLPSIVPSAPAGAGLTPRQRRRRAVGHAMAWSGFTEIIPTPFTANDIFDVWELEADDPRRNVVKVMNPLESDHAAIATTLLPAMLESLSRNLTRGQQDLALYGLGQVTLPAADGSQGKSPMLDVSSRPADDEVQGLLGSLPQQPLHVAMVAAGEFTQPGLWGQGRKADLYDAIESARTVARACGVEIQVANVTHLPWHPGRCAGIFRADEANLVLENAIGFAGELHPQVCERMNIPARTIAMELNLDAVPYDAALPAPMLSPYPVSLQDVAVVVDEDIPSEKVRVALAQGAGELLESVQLYDVYRSDQLGEGKISMTFALRFRANDRTLTDDECSAAREAAVAKAEQDCGATLRA